MTARTFSFSVSNVTALAAFAAQIAPGAVAEYPLLSLANNASGSYPFDPPAAAVAADIGAVHMLDWASMMDHDPVTRRWYTAGGRPRESALVQKMVIFDELANEVRAIDSWSGVEGGHLYRATTVIPEHRRVAYIGMGGPTIPLLDIDTEAVAPEVILKPPTNIGGFTNGWTGHHFLCWFAALGAQGSLVYVNSSRSRIVRFDWATQQWLAMGNFDGTWSNQHIAGHLHPITGKMIAGSSTASINRPLAIIEASGALSLTTPCPVTMACNSNGQFFPHPSRAASIVFCQDTDRIVSYEWDANAWVDRGPLPVELRSPQVIVAPMPWGGLAFEYGPGGTTKALAWKPNF